MRLIKFCSIISKELELLEELSISSTIFLMMSRVTKGIFTIISGSNLIYFANFKTVLSYT